MTKEEELEKEAEEWLNKWELCNKCENKVDCISNFSYCKKVVLQSYLSSAEPREKQIQALGERCLQLQKDKGNLTDKVKGLEVENESLRNDSSYYLQTIKTLSRKLKQNVDLVTRAVNTVEEWKKKTEDLEALNEKMKCCGNCENEDDDSWHDSPCDGCENNTHWKLRR